MECPLSLALNKNRFCFTRFHNVNPSFPTSIPRKISKKLFTSYPFVPQLKQRLCIDVLISRCSCKDDVHMPPSLNPIHVGWLKYFESLRRLASEILVLYIIGLAFIGEASGSQNISIGFSCEDASHYYASVDHKEGEDLMRELNLIISPHRPLSYKQVWEALKILDADNEDNPEASSNVYIYPVSHGSRLGFEPASHPWFTREVLRICRVEIYSQKAVSKFLAGKSEGWNREHLWPRSYGLNDGPSLSDLHNIRPADVNVNSSRGNKYYGECLANSTHCLKPANKEAAYDTETDKERWRPPLQVRGDIARSLMYMAVCYGFSQSDGSPNLHLSDSPSVENREMGLLSTLLKWNELDPPSRTEQLRNNRVCTLYQHNRNPFVDHPEYANLIWKKDTLRSQTVDIPLKAWINEFHYNNKGKDKNEFVEIVVESSCDATKLNVALYNGANGRIYRSLSLTDSSVFHVTEGGSGFLIYTAFVPLQNGPADGIALVSRREEDGHSQVIQFISYQGIVKAIDRPAIGAKSGDIHIQETEESTETDSLGLTGVPTTKFAWTIFKNKASPGRPNLRQMLLDSGS